MQSTLPVFFTHQTFVPPEQNSGRDRVARYEIVAQILCRCMTIFPVSLVKWMMYSVDCSEIQISSLMVKCVKTCSFKGINQRNNPVDYCVMADYLGLKLSLGVCGIYN